MCTKALLDVNKEPTDEEIKYALRNNYCRCTGYVKIIDAVRIAAKVMQEGTLPEEINNDWHIGSRVAESMLGKRFLVPENIQTIFTWMVCFMDQH